MTCKIAGEVTRQECFDCFYTKPEDRRQYSTRLLCKKVNIQEVSGELERV